MQLVSGWRTNHKRGTVDATLMSLGVWPQREPVKRLPLLLLRILAWAPHCQSRWHSLGWLGNLVSEPGPCHEGGHVFPNQGSCMVALSHLSGDSSAQYPPRYASHQAAWAVKSQPLHLGEPKTPTTGYPQRASVPAEQAWERKTIGKSFQEGP